MLTGEEEDKDNLLENGAKIRQKAKHVQTTLLLTTPTCGERHPVQSGDSTSQEPGGLDEKWRSEGLEYLNTWSPLVAFIR